MTGRMMVLAAGLALMVVPQASAQEAAQEAAHEAEAGHARQAGHARHARMRHRSHRGEQTFDRAVGRLMDRRYELNLTDDQLARLDDLRGNARAAMAPIREEMTAIHEGLSDGSLTREDAHERMESVHEKAAAMAAGHHDRLGEILEPEQQQMLRHGGARHGRPGRMGRHGGDRGH